VNRDPGDEDGAHERLAEDEGDDRRHAGQRDEGDPDTVQRSEHAPRIRPVRWFRNLTAILVALAAGCTAIPPPSGPQPETTVTAATDPTTSSSSTSTTAAPVTTTTLPGEPKALITPKGIPVAVRAVIENGYLVTSPCGVPTIVRDGEPVYGARVVLDPGHGGSRDVGAQGRNGLPEKQANLRVALETAARLEERGISVLLTRTGDYATTIPTRADLADHVGAEVLVSIHHNAPTPGPSTRPGTEIFYQSFSAESRRLGGVIYEHVVAALSRFTEVAWTAAPDAGVITVLNRNGRDTYGMIRRPRTPSVLVEMGYMSNPAEAELFATEEYVEVAATALADGIEAYLTTDAPGTGWYEPGRIFTAAPGLTTQGCEEVPLE
jgi:N-acetylmuramoyl-L-alanine amidase